MGIFDRYVGKLGELIDQTVAPDDVRLHVERGEGLLEAGDLDGAVRELTRALALRPDHARAALLLGRAELSRGDAAAAERALAEALRARPDYPEAEVLRGEARARLGDARGAEESLRRGLEGGLSDPDLRGAAWRGLGALYLASGRANKAVRELRKAAAALPGEPETNRLLGEALWARGDLDGARLCFEKAEVALAPTVVHEAPGNESEPANESREARESSEPDPRASRLEITRRTRHVAVLARLAELSARLGRTDDSRTAWERALSEEPNSVPARLGLAELDAAAGEIETARTRVDEAVAIERSSRTLRALGRRLAPTAPLDAQAAFEEARAAEPGRTDRVAISLEAMRLALAAADGAHEGSEEETALVSAAARAARRVFEESVIPSHAPATPRAPIDPATAALEKADVMAALALALLVGTADDPRDPERAAQLAEQAIQHDASPEARLVHARAALARGDRAAAAASLRRAVELSPAGDDRARRRLASVYRHGAPPTPHGPPDLYGLYALLRAIHARLQQTPELSDLAPEAARVMETLDRPLLLTVMGEFNAGKSTFVNALVGEEVAPMGILPTTATINVWKYGSERGGRVVYRDDTVRALPWHEVGPLLHALDEAEAARIRYVEVLYPLETLQRVNIVDTPGLNSIRAEHESTAREFIAQADAVVWLFSCRQPGTASEREALVKVREAHKQALGVVNQIDRLEDEAQVDEVLAHLRASFGDLIVELVPFSAREALLGRGDPERLLRSRRGRLDEALEGRFFRRAKAIQRAQAARRARALIGEAERRAQAELASGRREALISARQKMQGARARWGRFLVEERLALIADLDAVYAQAAREVLDFARPRSWPFGANQAAPADRDFLVDLIDERLGGLHESSLSRARPEVERATREALAEVTPREAPRVVADGLRLLEEQVYGRYRAFIRGFLRGGRVDDFFTRILPRLELGEQAIRRALLRDLPALDVLEEELLGPLADFGERMFARLGAALDRELGDEDLRLLEIEERLAAPIAQLAAALAAHPPEPPLDDAPHAPPDQAPHSSIDEADLLGDAASGERLPRND